MGDAHIVQGLIAHIGGYGGDPVHHIHPLGHMAKGGVLSVQMGRVRMHNEELGARRIGMGGTGHGDDTAGMTQRVVKPVAGKLTPDGIAGTADAGTHRIAALDHEARDDTVEDEPIIKAGLGQRGKILHRIGGVVFIQLDFDHAALFHFNGCNHAVLLRRRGIGLRQYFSCVLL